jgi:hypothetical protein
MLVDEFGRPEETVGIWVETSSLTLSEWPDEGGDEMAAVVIVVVEDGHGDLAHVALALHGGSLPARFVKGGKKDPYENGDDANYDKEFDQGEGVGTTGCRSGGEVRC